MKKLSSTYLETLQYVVGDFKEIETGVNKAFTQKIKRIVFVGCGANYSQMLTIKYIVDGLAKDIDCQAYYAGEIDRQLPVQVGNETMVVGMSHSGNTTEVFLALQKAKQKGAMIFGISTNAKSKLAEISDYHYAYPVGNNPSEMKLLSLCRLVLSVLQCNSVSIPSELETELAQLPDHFFKAHPYFASRAIEFAETHHMRNMFYVMGCGPTMGPGYAFTICKLMEMQWKDAALLNAAEFYHGPLEVTDENRCFVLFAAQDQYSQQVFRLNDYLTPKDCQVHLIDTNSVYNVDSQLAKEYLSPFLLWPALTMHAWALEEKTGHDIDVRRNMGKEDTKYPWN